MPRWRRLCCCGMCRPVSTRRRGMKLLAALKNAAQVCRRIVLRRRSLIQACFRAVRFIPEVICRSHTPLLPDLAGWVLMPGTPWTDRPCFLLHQKSDHSEIRHRQPTAAAASRLDKTALGRRVLAEERYEGETMARALLLPAKMPSPMWKFFLASDPDHGKRPGRC
ncbi:hypothetical protein KCP69_26600 (plasmid) [Salmonella enterica subsp. enterica]|nr:hypothetical protein KCP69_26600 [Salmonella enterica subsp. enterica]